MVVFKTSVAGATPVEADGQVPGFAKLHRLWPKVGGKLNYGLQKLKRRWSRPTRWIFKQGPPSQMDTVTAFS